MTTTDTASKFRYEGNGSTDTFAFPGRVFATTDLVVEIITRATDVLAETLTINTHYTVTIATDGTASVEITSAPKIPSSLQDIQIRRSLPQTQSLSLPTGTPFPAKTVETALDRVTALVQDLQEEVDRSIKISVTDSDTTPSAAEIIESAEVATEAAAEAEAAAATAVAAAATVSLPSITGNSLKFLRANLAETAIEYSVIPAASESAAGIVELATVAEAEAGTDTSRAITAEGLASSKSQALQNSQTSDYTLVLTDAGKHIYHPTSDDNARTFTIPANASVAYDVGTMITFVNDQNTVTIAITSDTLVLAGLGSTGSRTLAENGVATAIKVTSTRWLISGTGLT